MNLLVAFCGFLLVPVLIYTLGRTKLVSKRTADVLVGWCLIAAGLLFLVVGMVVLMKSGHLLNPSRRGPVTVAVDDTGWLGLLMALAMCVFCAGAALWSGLSVVCKRRSS